jgi:hypothetical protein
VLVQYREVAEVCNINVAMFLKKNIPMLYFCTFFSGVV